MRLERDPDYRVSDRAARIELLRGGIGKGLVDDRDRESYTLPS
jgi:hypothetical protein